MASIGSEIVAELTQRCFYSMSAPGMRVSGYHVPYPPTRLEEDYRPTVDRMLDAVDTRDGVRELSEQVFLLPDVGEGLVEAEIVTWKVNVGDHVALNQPLVDIETAKATVELPSPYEGTVVALHGKVGDVMEVHKPLITFEAGGGASTGGDECRRDDGSAGRGDGTRQGGIGWRGPRSRSRRLRRRQRRRGGDAQAPSPRRGAPTPRNTCDTTARRTSDERPGGSVPEHGGRLRAALDATRAPLRQATRTRPCDGRRHWSRRRHHARRRRTGSQRCVVRCAGRAGTSERTDHRPDDDVTFRRPRDSSRGRLARRRSASP